MITILLASYNGEKYLGEQIDSLLAQTVQDFVLYINDDQSTDRTFAIASGYAEKYPDKIYVSQNYMNSGGAKYNFIRMIIEKKDDYVMLCDQDDVWLPDKVEKSLRKITEMEEQYGKATPVLVHTDLCVVDNDCKTIAKSYEKMANTSFKKNALNNLVTMNIAAGCTIIYNRALADLVVAEPAFMVIHDWWLALVAAAFGHIETVSEPTVLYRQHGDNNIGAKKVLSPSYVYHFFTDIDKMAEKVNDSYKQAGCFLKAYFSRLSNDQQELLSAYASLAQQTKIKSIKTMVKYKTFMCGFARRTAQIIIITRRRVTV